LELKYSVCLDKQYIKRISAQESTFRNVSYNKLLIGLFRAKVMYYLMKSILPKRSFEDLETLSICNQDFTRKPHFIIQIIRINILFFFFFFCDDAGVQGFTLNNPIGLCRLPIPHKLGNETYTSLDACYGSSYHSATHMGLIKINILQ
jgi:hypothetical protein